MTVKVQRRTATTRNALNEPNYGSEANYPVIYSSMWARIEYPDKNTEFNETGERVKLAQSVTSGVQMFFEPTYTILEEDRITVLTSDNASLVNNLYLVMSVTPEWDGLGKVHHYVAELQVH